ncbi:hypothetical protein [Flavobacterium chungbukense]|uniref:Glycosyltransferase involved in cell wall biosynthesis n=1 Tax=Flavobacterium chungbukense TaxID=877464 RepID=A0ABP7YIE1_9FLAO|nr:hypothetical protein [Flavobacterium chungbukense]MCC4920181.1 hypothetical protein [Flavobacterium chungbukense]
MKILFICGSAEPGKDGVGDYTRRLSGELIRIGHEVQILSLCDHQANQCIREKQVIENTTILANRIPIQESESQRLLFTQETLNKFQPDWISLQFVPYSFNPKGLPFWMPSFLKKIKGNYNWHIMFHELWLAIDAESSFRHKCIGKLQQFIIRKVAKSVDAKNVTTQNKLYQYYLQSHKIKAEVLPICGNIPLTALEKNISAFTQFVLFGTIHHGAPFEDFIDDLLKISKQFDKPIKFVFIGKNGPELDSYTTILESKNVDYEILGIQSESVISQVLLDSDYGISTTPYFQTEKSGVYAAYKEHQLNTISVSRNWTPTKGHYTIPQIIKFEKNNLEINATPVQEVNVNNIAMQFINSISIS